MTVHFWPHTLDPNTASYRLRCLRVMEGLRNCRMDIALYNSGDAPEKLVLSKRYDPLSIQQALEVKKKYGAKLYLDICDNHFFYKKPEPKAIKRAELLRAAIQAVDVVIASSEYLAGIIGEEIGNATPIVVIGDLVDFPHVPCLSDKLKHPVSYFQFKALEFSLKRLERVKLNRLVWFGNHGGGYADCGMNDLESIRLYLEDLHEKTPISLTIISNSWRKYRALTTGWGFPTFYLPWDKTFFSSALSLHRVAVIPIQENPFTMAKTANRVETSLVHGLDVIADQIPSYGEYKSNIYLGDWGKGLSELIAFRSPDVYRQGPVDFKGKNVKTIQAWQSLFDN